jgi:hypothetical protein
VGLLLSLVSGGSPAAFGMNSMLGFDKLALKYKFLLGCPVVFYRAADNSTIRH